MLLPTQIVSISVIWPTISKCISSNYPIHYDSRQVATSTPGLSAELQSFVGRSRYAAEEISNQCITPSVAQFRAPLKQQGRLYYGPG